MEEQFQLKHYGKLSIFEQANMVSQDRAWWLKRLEKEFEERRKREEGAASSVSMPSIPSVSMPSISIPRR